jgi:hypothetical protein
MEPPNETIAPPDGVKIQDINLEADIFLIEITRHCWQGEHVLDPKAKAKVEVKGQEVAADRTGKPPALLVPKAMRGILTPGYARVDNVLARYTTRFAGAKALAASSKDKFFAELKEARAYLADCVAEFVDRYQVEVVDYNRAYWFDKLGADYDSVIGKLLPDASGVAGKFGYSIRNIRRLEAPSEEYKALIRADKELLAEVRKNKRADYEAAMEELVSGPRDALSGALDTLAAQLKDGKIIQPASFNAVLNAIALNRSFAGTITDSNLLATSTALKQAIDAALADAESKKTSSISWSDLLSGHKEKLAQAIAPVAEAAKDSAAVEQVRLRLTARVRPVDV